MIAATADTPAVAAVAAVATTSGASGAFATRRSPASATTFTLDVDGVAITLTADGAADVVDGC